VAASKREPQLIRYTSGDPELSIVDRGVVKVASQDEVRWLMAAAVLLKLDVVDIEPDHSPAARDSARIAVTGEDVLSQALRERGGLASRHLGI
jgi:hypothetical protein